MTSRERLGFGVDVSKDKVDFALSDGSFSGTVRRTSAELVRLGEQLQERGLHRVVVEATGGYEQLVLATLQELGLPVVLLQPVRARHFAKAVGQKAKTDAIDAAVLAHMACVAVDDLPLWEPPPADLADLRALYDRRSAVSKMLHVEKRRLRTARAIVADLIEASITRLSAEMAALDVQLERRLASSHLDARAQKLLEVRGVGLLTTVALLVYVPELGTINRRQVAALVGLAPMARDSGTWSGQRYTHGGRAQPRKALYMAALAGIRFNPHLRTFYRRLVSGGKPKKVALIACARKLVCHLNARLSDRGQIAELPAV